MILNTNRLKIVSLSYEELFDYVINKKGFVKTNEDILFYEYRGM